MTQNVRKGAPSIKKGDTVYFTAFTKDDRGTLYMCEGEVTKVPDGDKNKAYRVIVKAVGDHGIGKKADGTQISLIGRAISKRYNELSRKLGPIMAPKQWLR